MARRPRRARLQLRSVDPASALLQGALWARVGLATWMVAVAVLYTVLTALGVIGTINSLFGQLGSSQAMLVAL